MTTITAEAKLSIEQAKRRLQRHGYIVKRRSCNHRQFEIDLGNTTWIVDSGALPDFADRKLAGKPC